MKTRSLTPYIVTLLLFLGGCSASLDVKTPKPSSQKFSSYYEKQTTLTLRDQRKGSDKNISTGRIDYTLNNLQGNELQFLGKNLEKEMQSRGINLKNRTRKGRLILDVKKYQIINSRPSAYNPLWTYTTFSGDLRYNKERKRITFFWIGEKLPIWSMDEVNDPCFNVPLSMMVKEIAAKINSKYFGKRSSTSTVRKIDLKIKSMKRQIKSLGKDSEKGQRLQYLIPQKVMELGYTNNKAALRPLKKYLNDKDFYTRVAAISAIGTIGSADQFYLLKSIYTKKDDIMKAMALKAIGDLGTKRAINYLKKAKRSKVYNNEMFQYIIDLYI